jgi:hypothetical protein
MAYRGGANLPAVPAIQTRESLAALLFENEIAADRFGWLATVADHGEAATATAQVIIEADEVVQPPGFSQGSVTTGGSFAQNCIVFHKFDVNAHN